MYEVIGEPFSEGYVHYTFTSVPTYVTVGIDGVEGLSFTNDPDTLSLLGVE